MVTAVKGLNNYQKTLIVHIVALDSYSDEERAEHLKALEFCTDDVICKQAYAICIEEREKHE